MLKGLPLTYNRDMQEDKEPVFDAVDTLQLVLPALAGMIATMTVRVDRLAAAAPVGYTLATEVAEWLVRSGVPFREAHEITGALVALCVARDCALDEVSDEDLRRYRAHLTPERAEVLSVRGALAARTTPGSTGPGPVAEQLAAVADRWTAGASGRPSGWSRGVAAQPRGDWPVARGPVVPAARGLLGCRLTAGGVTIRMTEVRRTGAALIPRRTPTAGAPPGTRSCSGPPATRTSTSRTGCTGA